MEVDKSPIRPPRFDPLLVPRKSSASPIRIERLRLDDEGTSKSQEDLLRDSGVDMGFDNEDIKSSLNLEECEIEILQSPKFQKRQLTNESTPPIVKRIRGPQFSDGKHRKIFPISPIANRLGRERIGKAMDKLANEPNLIGDYSKPCCLPTVPGKHQDLRFITPETLSSLINGDYDEHIDRVLLIDCRYPYEYEGGHVKGATNTFTKDSLIEDLLKNYKRPRIPTKRTILVFYCEFCMERAPSLARCLRNTDRDINKDRYPTLYYPELYLIDGGYKAFYEQFRDYCDPPTYIPMHHKEHSGSLRHFRVRSRQLTGCKRKVVRCLKF